MVEQSNKPFVLAQSWGDEIMRWLQSLPPETRCLIPKLWQMRRDRAVFQKLRREFGEQTVENVRGGIETLRAKFRWNYQTLLSMLYVYCSSLEQKLSP